MSSLIFIVFPWQYLGLNKLAHWLLEAESCTAIPIDGKKKRMVNQLLQLPMYGMTVQFGHPAHAGGGIRIPAAIKHGEGLHERDFLRTEKIAAPMKYSLQTVPVSNISGLHLT